MEMRSRRVKLIQDLAELTHCVERRPARGTFNFSRWVMLTRAFKGHSDALGWKRFHMLVRDTLREAQRDAI